MVGLLAAPPLATASVLSAISGTVRLEVGSVPGSGLELSLIDLDTGSATRVRTTAAGVFQASVAPGLYAIDVRKSGYQIARGPHVLAAIAGQTVTASLALAVVAPPPVPAAGAGPRIVHEAVGCMAADENPEIEAVIEPAPSITTPRVYFHAARDDQFHYVDMIPEVGRFVACLPSPRPGSGPVTYYVAATADGVESRIADIEADVIDRASSCPAGRRMAAVCPCAAAVAAYLPNGVLSTPAGFAAGSAGAGIASTAVKIGAAVGIIGIGLLLGDNGAPASPSR
jgi:Carboxypeptidase regulatory-like domain